MIITCPACSTQFRVDGTRISASGTKVRCARCSHVWLQTPDAALPYAPPAAQAPPPPPPPPEPERAPAAVSVAPPPPEPAPPPPEPLPNLSRLRTLNREPEPEMPAEARAPWPQREAPPPSKAPPPRPAPAFPAGPAERRPLPVLRIAGLLAVMLLVGGLGYAILHYRGAIVSAVPSVAKAYCAIGLGVPMGGLVVKDVKAERTFADGVPYLEIRGQVVNSGAAAMAVPPIRAALRDKSGKELYSWIISASAQRLKPAEAADFTSRLPSPDPQSAMLTVGFATPCAKS